MIISASASMSLACQSSMSQENSASSNCPLFGAPPLEDTLRPLGERYPLTELEFSVKDILRWSYVNFGLEGTVNKVFGLAKNYFGFSNPPRELSAETVSVPKPETCASTLGYTIFAESHIVPSGSKIFLSPTLARSRTNLASDWEKNAGGTYWRYVSTRREGWDGFRSDEFHFFTFKESFSLNTEKEKEKENLMMESNRKFPAIFSPAPFEELLKNSEQRLLRHLGFYYFPWNDTIQVPSLTTLIRKWDELRLNHPLLPGLNIVLCEGTEENGVFVSSVLDGAIPISITTEYEHDITSHLMPTINLLSRFESFEGKVNVYTSRELTKYLNTKQTISSTLSYLFELIKEPHGKQFLSILFDRYDKDYSFSNIETTLDLKENFYDFCHTMVGILLDVSSAYKDLENYAWFVQTLNKETENFFTELFTVGWHLFLEKRYGNENTVLFKRLFVSALLPMIQVKEGMENDEQDAQ